MYEEEKLMHRCSPLIFFMVQWRFICNLIAFAMANHLALVLSRVFMDLRAVHITRFGQLENIVPNKGTHFPELFI